MNIGIDARLYGKEGRGLGRYISQLLLHLEKIDHQNEYTVFLSRRGYEEYVPQTKNFRKVLCDISWYGLQEQMLLPRVIASYRCDVVHFPHFNVPFLYRGKFALTIHDFILYDFPTTRATTRSALTFWVKYAAYRRLLRSAIERAQHIFVPSEYVRNRLFYHFPSIGEKKVTVTREGSSLSRSDLPREVGPLAIDGRYILAVGSAYPHKNLEALCDAFTEVALPELELRIVGKKDYFMRRLEQENLTRSDLVRFVGEVSDEELSTLYTNATALAFPSLEEGFGLPGVEALSYGRPVIAGDRASLPEVYQKNAYYVNPYDVQDIVRVLQEVVDNSRNVQLPVLYKEENSWLDLARKTVDMYEMSET